MSAILLLAAVAALAGFQPAAAATGLIRHHSGPIAISQDGTSVWVVNRDANSITRIAAGPDTVVAEIAVGEEPRNLFITPDGSEVWVTNFASNDISIVSAQTNSVLTTRKTLLGPTGIVINPQGTKAYVVNQISDSLLTYDTAVRWVEDRDGLPHRPGAIAMTTSGSWIIVQQYTSHWKQMTMAFIDPAGGSHSTAVLPMVGPIPQGDGGYPGINHAIAVAPGDTTVWAPGLDVNPQNGPLLYPGEGELTLTSTMQAVVREVRIAGREHIDEHPFGGRRRLNSAGAKVQMPSDVAFTSDGSMAYLACAFSNDVLKINTGTNPPNTLLEIDVGDYPNGIVLSPTASRAYVTNYLSRDVTVIDTETDTVVGTIAVTAETLPPEILNGKKLFFTSTGRMSTDSWMTCAGCHPDANNEGSNWDFSQYGRGERNTRSPRLAAGVGAFLSDGTWDEVQDGEFTIQGMLGGVGLADGPDNPPVGPSNAGRSQDLDDLAAFIGSLKVRPQSPFRVPLDQSLRPSAANGKAIFDSDETGCRYCHPEPLFTDRIRHDVGTFNLSNAGCSGCHPPGMLDEALGEREANAKAAVTAQTDLAGYLGFITPTLWECYNTGPFLHSGRALYLQSLLTGLNQHDEHGRTSQLTTQEQNDLIQYLNSIAGGLEDVSPPRIEFARAMDATELVVRFLEPVDPQSATDIASYSIDNGVSVLSASLKHFTSFRARDGLTVHLFTTPHEIGPTYTVTVSGVKDLSANANAIAAPGASASYSYGAETVFTVSDVDSLFTSRLGRDTYIDSGEPSWNFGHSDAICAGTNGATRRSLVMFDFYPMLCTLIADSSDIVSAKIELRLKSQATTDPVSIRVHRLLTYFVEGSAGAATGIAYPSQSNWTSAREGMLAWNAPGASQSTPGIEGDSKTDYLAGNDHAYTPDDAALVSVPGEVYEWDVTHATRWAFANPHYFDFGYLLMAADESDGTEKVFYSLQDDVEANRPRLVITVRTDQAVAVASDGGGAAIGYALEPSRPNPSSGQTRFAFSLPVEARVTLRLFDASGRSVRRLVEGPFGPGRHEVDWDGRDESGRRAAAGRYFYRIKAGRFSDVGQVVLVR